MCMVLSTKYIVQVLNPGHEIAVILKLVKRVFSLEAEVRTAGVHASVLHKSLLLQQL